jgi:DNA (cytosine-5)-methyltransferase 1
MVAHTLRGDGFDASEDGPGRGTPLIPVAFAENSRAELRLEGGDGTRCGALNTGGGKPGQGVPMIAFSCKDHGADAMFDLSPTLRAGCHSTSHANAGVMPAIAQNMAVRRLTPRECERLQGFPDDYTLIPVRGKPAADGPRYKALGNSMAVPVMRWIGERIKAVEMMTDNTAMEG